MIIPGIFASQISGKLLSSSYESIATANPSAVSTITFSSIPNTYKSLELRFSIIMTVAGQILKTQFNGDTASNYGIHVLGGNGSGTGVGANTPATSMTFGYGGSLVGTYPNVGIMDVIDYANTTKFKTVKLILGGNNNTSTGDIELDSGAWRSTAAITSLTFFTTAGTFTGTISLYGIKG
jgi:hypothetical protein